MDESSLLKTEDLARRFGVTPDTIVNWTNRKLHPDHPLPYVRPGRFYLFNPQEVERWVSEGGIARMGDAGENLRASA